MYKVNYQRNGQIGSRKFELSESLGKFITSNIFDIELLGVFVLRNGDWIEVDSSLLEDVNTMYVKGDKVVRCIDSVYSDVEIVQVLTNQYRVLNINSGLTTVINKDDVVDFISK